MGAIADLMKLPGVMVAGEYAGHGDSCDYQGELDTEMARLATIMCRATTLGVTMEGEMLQGLCAHSHCGFLPVMGWTVTGPRYTVCVLGRLFCFMANGQAPINDVLAVMQRFVADRTEPDANAGAGMSFSSTGSAEMMHG